MPSDNYPRQDQTTSLYQQLELARSQAIRKKQLPQFIEFLNTTIDNWRGGLPFLHWLFLARAYSDALDIESAASCYTYLLQNADVRTDLVEEVKRFATVFQQDELLKLVSLTPSSPRLPRSSAQQHRNKPKTQRRPVTSTPDLVKNRDPTTPPTPEETAGRNASPGKLTIANGIQTRGDASPEELYKAGRQAFDHDDLESALQLFHQAYDLGDRSVRLLHVLGQTYQRLQQFDTALDFLNQGLPGAKGADAATLLVRKAEILATQERWEEGAAAYQDLLNVYQNLPGEERSGARVFAQRQMARAYLLGGDASRAKVTLEPLIARYPNDKHALNLMVLIEDVLSGEDLNGDDYAPLLVRLPADNPADLISDMLESDLHDAEFRDETILLNGGQPTVEDAIRLLQHANARGSSEYGERYPLFLEAAKAFSLLPRGSSFDINQYHQALARYAMNKAGALILAMRRLLLSSETVDLIRLQRLRDSVTSYCLASLGLQTKVDQRFVLILPSNHMRAELAYALAAGGKPIPTNFFQRSLGDLLELSLNSPDTAHVAYECVVAWGAASGNFWIHIQNEKGGTGRVTGMLRNSTDRQKAYAIFAEMSASSFPVSDPPNEVLRTMFLERRNQHADLELLFNKLKQIPCDPQHFTEILDSCEQLPTSRGALLDTDLELLRGARSVWASLAPYQTRSPDERTRLLLEARMSTEDLLRVIGEYPTYWGRVGWEPLFLRWQTALQETQKQRVRRDTLPKLEADLESPFFRVVGDVIEGTVVLRNSGRSTVDGVHLRAHLQSADSRSGCAEYQREIKQEIGPGETYHQTLEFVAAKLLEEVQTAYHLELVITPFVHSFGEALDNIQVPFTVEVLSAQRSSLQASDILWSEQKVPNEHLFKGRKDFLDYLEAHLRSPERNKTYMLYGLTRYGKTSILSYLGKQINLTEALIQGSRHRFITFEWNFASANGRDTKHGMWSYLLQAQIFRRLYKLSEDRRLPASTIPAPSGSTGVGLEALRDVLLHLKDQKLYPIILIDEFTYYRKLADKRWLDESFLAEVRSFAIDGLASFVCAGTYGLHDLIKDPQYGITGQLVNVIESQVTRIHEDHAKQLMQVMEPDLRFTDDAKTHIMTLSDNVPYFIQLLCNRCGRYAAKSGRSVIGYPEVEAVVQALISRDQALTASMGIEPLSTTVFQDNLFSESDPHEYRAIISTICDRTRNQLLPRAVSYADIQRAWKEVGVQAFLPRLAAALPELCDRQVLIQEDDEGSAAFRISVDLFRRWWANEHRYLSLELHALGREG